MSLVKICGITDPAAARAAAAADLVGFHFCSSRRRVTPEVARGLIEALAPRPVVVGVFIDQKPEEVAEIADFCGLDMVQLHGDEAPGQLWPRPVIKALKIRDGGLPDATAWPDPILLDSWTPSRQGGSGRAWDWSLAEPLLQSRKVIVAGGLNPGNVADLIRAHRPYAVDVSSGVEREVGKKDPGLIRSFIEAVRRANEHIQG